MKPIILKEILPYEQYEILRPRLRPLFIAEKDRRRLAVGENLTLLFENGQTVWYQVQEMIRTERITDEAAIRHEIDTYNELLPRPGEIAATMLLEFTDVSTRNSTLRALIDINRHLSISIGSRRQLARFDERQMDAQRVSSVQFVRFALGGIDSDEFFKLADAGQVAIELDHPHMRARAAISGAIAHALARDLAD
jgi:hypothetical protein